VVRHAEAGHCEVIIDQREGEAAIEVIAAYQAGLVPRCP
jgi:hypothetical protein